MAAGLIFFLPRALGGEYRFRPMIVRQVVNDMAHFAFANYVSAMLWSAPMLLLPRVGLVGAGVAWFVAQASVAALILGRFALNR